MTCRTDVGQSQHGGSAQLALDREIEMLGVGDLVVNVVSWEISHWLVLREVECLIGGAARRRGGERKALSLAVGASVQPISEGLREVGGTRTGPVQAKGSVGYFVEEIQVLDRRVIQAKRRTDAGFARSAEYLAQNSVTKAWRVGKTDARSEVVVPGRSQRFGDAGITGVYKALGRIRKDR